MKPTKRLLALLLALCMALTLAACGEAEPEHMTVRAVLVDAPHTLDPALAVTETEKTVDAQLFENLMKINTAGALTPAQAASYTYTDNMDGTETYTFTLRNDIYWSDGQKVTAGDQLPPRFHPEHGGGLCRRGVRRSGGSAGLGQRRPHPCGGHRGSLLLLPAGGVHGGVHHAGTRQRHPNAGRGGRRCPPPRC